MPDTKRTVVIVVGSLSILESSIERAFVKHANFFKAYSLKVNRTGWPDRIVTVKNGYCFYIEFKRPNELPRKLQLHIHSMIRLMGFHVYVCDNIKDAKMILDYEIHVATLYKKRMDNDNLDAPELEL